MAAFRRLPGPVRRAVVHGATPSYTVGAVAVLRRPDGCIALLAQRHSDGWALPGGLLRRHEAPADGVVREVAEELGIRLDPLALPVPFAAVDPLARRVDVVYYLRVGDEVDLRIVDDDEVTDIGWFALDALPPASLPTLDILRALRMR